MNTASNREKVLRKLGRRGYSSYELIFKLKSEIPEIKDIAEEFIQKGYLDDAAWIADFIAAEERKGRGPLQIGAKLRMRGIPQEVVNGALSKTASKEAIRLALEKELRKGKDKHKIINALARKGFSWDDINLIIEML